MSAPRLWSWSPEGMRPAECNYLAPVLYVRESDVQEICAQRDMVADALELMLDLWARHCAPRIVEEDSQVIASRAALRKVGR